MTTMVVIATNHRIMATLPPGQKARDTFPRFGLPQYADRFPTTTDHINLSIGGEVEEFVISGQLDSLTRIDQNSDFHCVTTWSKLDLNWSGYRFSDFYDTLIKPKVSEDISFVVLKAQDGYKTSMYLEDLLREDVLLADQLDGEPLNIEHGTPIRIVAPAHYGYKNVKHLKRLEFYKEEQKIKQGIFSFMDHPRARVAKEERASTGPSLFFRFLYSFGIESTVKDFAKATAAHRAKKK